MLAILLLGALLLLVFYGTPYTLSPNEANIPIAHRRLSCE